MKKIIFLLSLIIIFLAIKLTNNGIRLSDTNTYFNIANQMLQGKILYKDIFFSNFPLFSYISFLYYFIGGKSLNFFYFTADIEVAIITFLIYLITYRKTKNYIISITSSILYIFSFMVMSTSDHQTGVFTASLFAVLSYLFLQKKRNLLSGVFIALASFTKAYFLPILLSFLIYLILKKEWKNLLKFSVGFAVTGFVILLPSLIQAPQQLISDIFGFSLTRPEGISKTDLAWFFITKDFLFFIILLFNLLNIRKNILFGLVSTFSLIFFFAYQDIYYLYLNFFAPFLCLSFYEMLYFVKEKFNLQRLVVPTIISFFILLNLFVYVTVYRNVGKIENIDQIIKIIKAQNPKFLYGAIDITPALIVLTNIPALDNVDGAHEYFFTRKIYNSKSLTDDAIKTRTIIIAHGGYYPQYNLREDIMDKIFVKDTVYKNCKIIMSVPVLTGDESNRINFFKCY